MAHHYTRGAWTAPETRNLDPKHFAAPYCTPAQMVVPLMTRWMLVFEDPGSNTLWLAKGTPRNWLEDGKAIAVSNAPTRWGPVSFRLRSRLHARQIECIVSLASRQTPDLIKLRLRVPEGNRIQSVTLDGTSWSDFNPLEETVTLHSLPKDQVTLAVHY
jgi:hypothetical protein